MKEQSIEGAKKGHGNGAPPCGKSMDFIYEQLLWVYFVQLSHRFTNVDLETRKICNNMDLVP